jgi:Tol biopolymer transport system component
VSGGESNRVGVIVYVHEGADGRPHIRVVVPGSSFATRRLRLGREPAFGPQWSADGRRLLFARPSGIYVAGTSDIGNVIDVLRVRRISRFFTEWGVEWSPDATSVAYTREVERRFCTDLYTMRTDASRQRRLTASAACEQRPAWSPDGLEIAFEQEGDMSTEIVVTDLRGRNRRILGEGTFPAWSPDGRSLAFLTAAGIAVVDRQTGAFQRTLEPENPYDELENGLTWSPDGTRLAFGFHDPEETFPLTHLALIDAGGENSERLTVSDTFPDMEPDWQPICTLYGTNGDDVLTGTPGDDLICGLRGNDRIRGGGGNDTILGGDGNDWIVGGPGTDRLFGAAGDDRVYARDAEPDVVNGGPGRDRVWVDQADTVSEAEDRRD